MSFIGTATFIGGTVAAVGGAAGAVAGTAGSLAGTAAGAIGGTASGIIGGIGNAIGGVGSALFGGGGAAAGSVPIEYAGLGLGTNVSGIGTYTGAATALGTGGMSGLGTSLMLGQAGLALANAFSSQGSVFQDKVKLSKEAEALKGDYSKAVFDQWDEANRGDTGGRETPAIHSLKTAAGVQDRGYKQSLSSTLAKLNNKNTGVTNRGKAAVGGGLAKLAAGGMKNRFQNLFAPGSTLHNFQREGMLNAAKGLSNLYAQERQVGMYQTQGQYANWLAENMASADRGAAIGGAISGMGNFKANEAYLNMLTR